MRVGDLGERGLIEKFLLRGYAAGGTLPAGDDAGAVRIAGLEVLLKTDAFCARDVSLQGMRPEGVGFRAVNAVASDLLAKLATPVAFSLALFLPPDTPVPYALGLVRGAAWAARGQGAQFLGGDTNRGSEVALAASGLAWSPRALPRGGQPGDLVYLLGERWGLSGAAIHAHYHQQDLKRFPRIRKAGYWPKARRAVLALQEVRQFLSGSADSSDGLAETLWQLSIFCHCAINLTSLPVHPELLAYAQVADTEPETLVLYGGEEFELVLLVAPEGQRMVEEQLLRAGILYQQVGRLEAGSGVFYRQNPVLRSGYDQLREG